MPRQPLWWAAHSLIRPEECQGEREPCTLDWFALNGAGVPPSLCISKLYTRACLIVFFRRVPAGHFTSADDCEHSFLSLSKCVFVRLDGSELCSFACRSCQNCCHWSQWIFSWLFQEVNCGLGNEGASTYFDLEVVLFTANEDLSQGLLTLRLKLA